MITKNFHIKELVHPDIYGKWGDASINFLSCHAPKMLQRIRDHLGQPITINNWHVGGGYQNSGLRLPRGDVGASLSAHRFGCAFDLKFAGISTDEVYSHIMGNQDLYNYITRIEHIEATRSKYGSLGRDWLHIECGERDGMIYVFKP